MSSNSEKWPIKSETFQDQSVFSRHCEQSEQGFLWIVRMTGAWCRLVSWQADTASRDLGLTSQLWTWERVESGVHCEWIFLVSVLAICLPSRPNFLRHRVTLTWVQAKGWELRWDNNHKNITRTKNISQALGEFPLILIHRISNSFGLSDKSSLKVGEQKYSVDNLELAQFTYGCHVGSGCKYLNTRIRPHFCDYNDKPVKSEAFTWNTVTY